jgi:hypothetical protein
MKNAVLEHSLMKRAHDPKKWENFKWAPQVNPKDVDIIIASFNENLWYVDYLKKFGYNVVVYNVSGLPINSFLPGANDEPTEIKPVECRYIPNQSQEASQWLHHLVHARGSLNKFNIFLQGDLGYGLKVPIFEGVGPDRVMELFNFLNTFLENQSWLNVPIVKTTVDRVSPDLRKRFSVFFEPLKAPDVVPRYFGPSVSGGQFLVSKANLLRIPESHLKKLLDYTVKERRAAWEFEYHWGLLLDAYACVWPYQNFATVNSKEIGNKSSAKTTAELPIESVNL